MSDKVSLDLIPYDCLAIVVMYLGNYGDWLPLSYTCSAINNFKNYRTWLEIHKIRPGHVAHPCFTRDLIPTLKDDIGHELMDEAVEAMSAIYIIRVCDTTYFRPRHEQSLVKKMGDGSPGVVYVCSVDDIMYWVPKCYLQGDNRINDDCSVKNECRFSPLHNPEYAKLKYVQ